MCLRGLLDDGQAQPGSGAPTGVVGAIEAVEGIEPRASCGTSETSLARPTPWLGSFNTKMIWCNSHGLDCRETGGFGWPFPPWDSYHRRA